VTIEWWNPFTAGLEATRILGISALQPLPPWSGYIRDSVSCLQQPSRFENPACKTSASGTVNQAPDDQRPLACFRLDRRVRTEVNQRDIGRRRPRRDWRG